MADRDDDLAVTPDPAFHARLRDELSARLAVLGTDAAASGPEPEVVMVDIETAPRRRRRGRIILATAAAVTLALVAGVVAVSRRGDPDLLGPQRPATGAPVTVGFLTEDADGPDARAARAAARYVNEHLGGIRGRPLELDVCEMDSPLSDSTTATTACADRMASRQVPVVLHGTTVLLGTAASILSNLGVPLVTDMGGTGDGGGMAPGDYRVGHSGAALAAPAALAASDGARRVLILVAIANVTQTNPLIYLVETAAKPAYDRAGIGVAVLADPVGEPDRLREALVNVDQVQIIGETSGCAPALKALRAAGFTGTTHFAFNCGTPAVAAEAGGEMAGARLVDDRALVGSGEDLDRYRAVLATYGAELDPADTGASAGYRVVVAFAQVMAASQGEITQASVRSAFDTMDAMPLPLSLGQTFRCDGKQVRDNPYACSRAAVVSTLDAEGQVTGSKVVDLTKILGP